MIISIFKKNYFLQLILLIAVPLLLWIPAFIHPPAIFTDSAFDMPLFDIIKNILPQKSIINSILAFVIVAVQALLVNYILTFYELTKKNSYLPAFIYLLLFSCDYRVMTLSGIMLANCFLILAIFTFLQCYGKSEGLDPIFLSALFVSIASLFHTPYILFILWIWIGLFNFKIYKFRPIAVSLLGLLTPYLILLVVYYLENKTQIISNFFPQHFLVLPQLKFLNQPVQIVYMAYMFCLILPAIVYTLKDRNDRKLSVRKRTSTIVLLFVISLLPFLYNMTMPAMSLIFAPTVAFMLTVFFISVKRNIYADLFIIILVLLTVTKILINYQF